MLNCDWSHHGDPECSTVIGRTTAIQNAQLWLVAPRLFRMLNCDWSHATVIEMNISKLTHNKIFGNDLFTFIFTMQSFRTNYWVQHCSSLWTLCNNCLLYDNTEEIIYIRLNRIYKLLSNGNRLLKFHHLRERIQLLLWSRWYTHKYFNFTRTVRMFQIILCSPYTF